VDFSGGHVRVLRATGALTGETIRNLA
jgi:hypothetical protein